MPELVVEIGGVSFFTGDLLVDARVDYTDFPSVLVHTFDDNNTQHVILRDATYEYETLNLDTFVQLVQDGTLTYLAKPLYFIGQSFVNKYTEKRIDIINVPFARNDEGDEYSYYVREWTPTYGHNFKCLSEKEITDFYEEVGGELV